MVGFLVAWAMQGLDQAVKWAAVLGVLTGVVTAIAAVLALVGPSRTSAPVMPPPPPLEVEPWVVARPTEVAGIVSALLHEEAATVGITTSLQGAGGFGKTTLALMVGADPQVRKRFSGYVYLVTVGRDVRGASAIAAKVNDVIKFVAGEDVTFTDPELAGRRLGSLLDVGPRRLLILDDLWEPEQLAPFVEGGRRCARLVTTRALGLLVGRGTAVQVDQMSREHALKLLTSGLPMLTRPVAERLLDVTGRWPLLLRLVNKILVNTAAAGADVSEAGEELYERLRAGGPAVVDDLLGEAGRRLRVDRPQERARAVRATIEASTSLLDPGDGERFAELGVFAAGETIPFSLIRRLWSETASLDNLQALQVCARLRDLALVTMGSSGTGGVALHDVVGDFLRAELGSEQLTQLHGRLLDAVATDLPPANSPRAEDSEPGQAAWWELGDDHRYIWDHLVEHLLGARRFAAAEAIVSDLRWVGARLQRFGPAAPSADLSHVDTPRMARLRAVLARLAHLLTTTEPERAVVDVLHSRVAEDPDWRPQVTALRDVCPRPRLVNRWPLPDLLGVTSARVVYRPAR
jgi:hypothetical protein